MKTAPYKSEDMMVTRVRSRDNGVMRVAIAFHRRDSIGGLERGEDGSLARFFYRTTAEFDEWATNFMGLPGLKPYRWGDDPQHKGLDMNAPPAQRMQDMRERGPKRDILVLDTEDQAMLFKLRWQDET